MPSFMLVTASSVDYADAREVAAKGFGSPLVAFPVRGLSMRSVRRTIPFVGRADELARAVGDAFMPAYAPIAERRRDAEYGERGS